MSIKPDHWIRRMALEHKMIDPFTDRQVREGTISYGLSSFGYDIRVADEFRIFTPATGQLTVVDPKALDEKALVPYQGDVCIIPPNSFALARTMEYFRMPRNVLGVVLGKCLTGDTRVVDATTGAYVPIQEMSTDGATMSFANGQIQALKSQSVISQGVKDVYRLKLRSGRHIRATENHPLLTATGWTALGSLRVGDRVAVARNIPVFGTTPLPDWEAALLGLMISEGQCYTPGNSPVFTSADPQLVELLRWCVTEGWNGKVTYKGRYGYRLVNQLGRGGLVTKNRATQWLSSYGLKVGASQKFVPQAIFMAPREIVVTFLRALFSGDGSVYRSDRSRSITIEYTSVSRRLIEDVHHLLLRFGISANIREKHPRFGRTAWTITIHNKNDIVRFSQEIGFWPGSIKQGTLEEFMPLVENRIQQPSKGDALPGSLWAYTRGLLGGRSYRSIGIHFSPQKMTYAEAGILVAETGDPWLVHMASPDVLWDVVRSIEADGREDVYDICVPEAHNFVANDIIVHNSTYARVGVITNFTPLEPSWEGHITIEISNTTPLPAKIYANEGIAQVLFFEGEAPEISYADRKGKYQAQTGITLPRL